jgi:small multidrug resistance pump
MHWLALITAILFEVTGTSLIKISNGFKNLVPTIGVFIFYGLSFYFLSIAVKKIDLSIAYAIWSGIGTFAIAVIGFALFKEKATVLKIISIFLIIAGVIGLNLASHTK